MTITLLVVSSEAFNCSRRFWPEVAREVLARKGGSNLIALQCNTEQQHVIKKTMLLILY